MTRPIFEPTPQRKDASLDYGQQQLFRRPAPTVDTNIPLFRALQTTSNFQTLGDGSVVVLLWSDWENLDSTVFDANLTGGKVGSVDLLLPGVYYFSCTLYLQALTTGSVVIRMADGWEQADFYSQTFQGNVTGGGAFLFSLTRSFSPYHFSPDAGINEPPYAKIEWSAAQTTGISRNTLFGTSFEIGYLGGFSGTPES